MRLEPVQPNEPLAPGVYYMYIRATNAIVEIVRRWPELAQRIAEQMQHRFAGRVRLRSLGLARPYDDGALYWAIEATVTEQEETGNAQPTGTAAPMVAPVIIITGVAIVSALALILGITLTVRSIVRVRMDACAENPDLCRSREATYRLVAIGIMLAAGAWLMRQIEEVA